MLADAQTVNSTLEKKGLITFSCGTALALGSELLNQNGINAELGFTGGVVLMIAGCVALILSDRKKD